eukprot:2790635-Prymnesium_polylepis.2
MCPSSQTPTTPPCPFGTLPEAPGPCVCLSSRAALRPRTARGNNQHCPRLLWVEFADCATSTTPQSTNAQARASQRPSCPLPLI